jgi:hypothetical protein
MRISLSLEPLVKGHFGVRLIIVSTYILLVTGNGNRTRRTGKI